MIFTDVKTSPYFFYQITPLSEIPCSGGFRWSSHPLEVSSFQNISLSSDAVTANKTFALYCKSSLIFCSVLQIDCENLAERLRKITHCGQPRKAVTLPLLKTTSSMISGHRIQWFSSRLRSSFVADTSS